MPWLSVFKGSQVDAALDRVMDNGFVHYRGRTPAVGHWRMNASADMLRPERYDGASWVPQGVLLSARQRTLYVAKHGADTNVGTNPDAPFLTFGAALTAAAALTPSQSAPVTIACQDAGAYTEDLVGVAWVNIHAPGATLIPATNAGHEIKDGCRWCFYRATRIHTGFKMISGGHADVELASCGTEAGAVNGQWMFLVDGRSTLLGGTLNVNVGAYLGESCICGCYGDADEGFINFHADSVDVIAGGTSTWWDFFAEQSVVGKRCDINVSIRKYIRLTSGAGCFRPFAANPGVRVSVSAIVNEVSCASGTVCEAAKSGGGTGAYCSLVADAIEGQTIANASTAGNKVRIITARKPSPLVLAGVLTEISVIDGQGFTGTVWTHAGRLDVTDATDSTAPTNGSIHTAGGLGAEKEIHAGKTVRVNAPGTSDDWLELLGPGNSWKLRRSFGNLDIVAGTRFMRFSTSTGNVEVSTGHGITLDDGDVLQAAAAYHYFGDPTVDGSWRFGRSGTDWVFQRRESSVWVTKSTITA